MENRLTQPGPSVGPPDEGQAGGLPFRQYEFLFEMTTQLLAAPKLDEQLSLVLDAVTAGLGYAQAAVAVMDNRRGVLRVRQAVGFADEDALTRLEFSLDSNEPHVRVVHEGSPTWITREGGD